MSLAERYKQARLVAGYSQGEMAELTNSTPTSISKIERGLVANPRHLSIHAKHLGVSESYLLFGSKEISSIQEYSQQYQMLNKGLQQLDREGQLKGDIFQIISRTLSLAKDHRKVTIAS